MPVFDLVLEVMDKEWSLRTVWLVFLTLGAVGHVVTRVRRWLIFPALLAIFLVAYALVAELTDPQVGPAIVQEAGWGYVIQSCIAIGLATALTVVGLSFRKRAV